MHNEDILSHIDPSKSMQSQANLLGGCNTILNDHGVKLEVCWSLNFDQICVELKLVALGESIVIAKECLSPGEKKTFSGHIGNFAKAEVTLEFEFLKICYDATACINLGDWKCVSTGNHCIGL